jgi:Amt family ammonium transporter
VERDTLNSADISWMLVSTALVLLMTPALAFFYGGLVRSKKRAQHDDDEFRGAGRRRARLGTRRLFARIRDGTQFVGGLRHMLLRNVGLEAKGSIPHVLFMCYQGTFAIITVALISGAIVERMRFNTYLLFLVLWTLVVYAPVAHWVWGGGFLATRGALDYAGGTVVHVNAGVAAFVAAMVLGPRRDYARQAFLPHNVPFTLLGAGLLWFGWFGFNAGSALGANPLAALALTTTLLAPASALVAWTILDLIRARRVTAVGGATGIVVGLVAVTPAAGFISPMSAIVLGAIAAVPSHYALSIRARTRLDDSLDVVGAHGLGGAVGAILTGVFADSAWNPAGSGLISGNPGQLGAQFITVLVVAAYSGTMTFVLLKLLGVLMPLRVGEGDEGLGLDVTQHGEEAYASGEGAILVLPDRDPPVRADD